MDRLNLVLIGVLVSIPTLFGAFGKTTEMGIAAAAIAIALCFANLDKFTRFKGLGFEAELRTAVQKAYAAIEQLKELALALSAPIVDELAISGRMFQYIHLKHKLQRVEKIAETLKGLGASPAEIDEATKTIYGRLADDHRNNVFFNLRNLNPGKKDLFAGLEDGKMDGWDLLTIRQFITNNDLTTDKDTEEAILDMQHFLTTKKLRREDVWQS